MYYAPSGVLCKDVLSIIDHLTRSALLVPLPNKEALTVANALIERAIGIFGPPGTLHSDLGPEFETKYCTRCNKFSTTEKRVLHYTGHKAILYRTTSIPCCTLCYSCTAPPPTTTGPHCLCSFSCSTTCPSAQQFMKPRY